MGLDMNQAGIDQIADENITWLEKHSCLETIHMIEVMKWWKVNAYADRERDAATKELSEAKGLAKQLLKAIAVHRAKQIERKQFVDPIDKELWEVLK